MCRIFEREKLWQKAENGELELHISSNPLEPPFVDHKGQCCIHSEEITIIDSAFPEGHHRREVAIAHRFITDEGKVGASGLVDPKDLMIGDTNYRLIKKKDPRCELCEAGDMIPVNERFFNSNLQTSNRADLRALVELRAPKVSIREADCEKKPANGFSLCLHRALAPPPFVGSRNLVEFIHEPQSSL